MLSLMIVLIAALIFWWVWINPFNFTHTTSTDYEEGRASHRVFAFGTLKNPWVRTLIMRAYAPTEDAILPDYRRQRLDLCAEQGSETHGLVFEATQAQLQRLDRYERVGVKYERVLHLLKDGEPAWVYRILPELRSDQHCANNKGPSS